MAYKRIDDMAILTLIFHESLDSASDIYGMPLGYFNAFDTCDIRINTDQDGNNGQKSEKHP